MLQFEDSDEDDCESFFLRPTNEYNIAEKIKQANQELFETPHPPDTTTTTIPMSLSGGTSATQRVTFSQTLVDYEPEYSEEDDNNNSETKNETNTLSELDFCELIASPSIDEEESDDCNMDEEEINEEIDEVATTTNEIIIMGNEVKNLEILASSKNIESLSDSNGNVKEGDEPLRGICAGTGVSGGGVKAISELCDEIVKLNVTEFSSSISVEDQSDSVCDETIIDNPEFVDHSTIISIDIPLDVDNSSLCSAQGEHDYMMMMVMSKQDLKMTTNGESAKRNIDTNLLNKNVNSISNNNNISSSKNNSRNSSGTRSPRSSPRKDAASRKCCSFKRSASTMNNLPKYSGFYSQYGLSKQQIEKRNSYIVKIQQKQKEIERQNYEMNLNKTMENEKAFAFWLKKKLKYPKNRTKNMFDVIDNQKNRKKRNSLADGLLETSPSSPGCLAAEEP